MNANFHSRLTQASELIVADYGNAVEKNATNQARIVEIRKVTASLMERLLHKGLIRQYSLSDQLDVELTHFSQSVRSTTPADPNQNCIAAVCSILGDFLKEQAKLNEVDPDNPWFRLVERQLVRDYARNLKLYGLIKDYRIAGDRVGAEPQGPEIFLTDKQVAKLKAHTVDFSPTR